MPSADLSFESERRLRPLRSISATLAYIQTLGLLALFFVMFLLDARLAAVAYAIAGGIVLAEMAQWALARVALSKAPALIPQQLYASAPLQAGHRRLVDFNLLSGLIAPILLVLEVPMTSFKHEKIVAFLVLAAACAPSYLSLWRVRRHRSWLAIARIPARPRQQRSPEH